MKFAHGGHANAARLNEQKTSNCDGVGGVFLPVVLLRSSQSLSLSLAANGIQAKSCKNYRFSVELNAVVVVVVIASRCIALSRCANKKPLRFKEL